MNLKAAYEVHTHKANITDKQHFFDKGFCPEHPDIKIRKKNFLRSETLIPCPECAANRALDRRKKEMEINHHSKEAASPVEAKVYSVDDDEDLDMKRLFDSLKSAKSDKKITVAK